MIHVHITTDREFAPAQGVEIKTGASIAFGGHLLSLNPDDRDLSLTVASKSGAVQVAFRCLDGGPGRHVVEQLHPDGTVAKRLRYDHHMLGDGPNGEPAMEVFAPDGRLLTQARFTVGVLNDGQRGEPALTEHRADGGLRRTERRRSGKLQDGPNAEPAIVEYDAAGQVANVAHYREGKLLAHHDAAASTPSRPTRRDPSRGNRPGPGVV